LQRSKPESIGDILAALMKTSELGEQFDQAQIWEHWPKLAGPYLCKHGRPQGVKDGLLTIEVDSPVWEHKFLFHRWRLMTRVNRMAGRELISDIFIKLAPDEEKST